MSKPIGELTYSLKNLSFEEQQKSQSLFDTLPTEIVLLIFSYLRFVDLWRASQVCNDWYQRIKERNLLPKVRQLSTEKLVGKRALYISSMHLALVSETKEVSRNAIQLWDLTNETPLKAPAWSSSLRPVVGCNHYLLTKHENTLGIFDIFLGKLVELSGRDVKQWSHFSINQHGFTFVINYGTESANVWLYSIKQDRTAEKLDCHFSDSYANCPVSLLHGDWVIYSSYPGMLRIRSLANKGRFTLVGKDLMSPEIEHALSNKTMTKEKITSIMERNAMLSILASGSILVTLSKQNLLVWDLNTRRVTRTFPPITECLDALDGFTLLTHTTNAITLWDLKEEKITKKAEWKNSNTNCENPAGLYNNKVYILSEKEDTGTFTVYDFSKKV